MKNSLNYLIIDIGSFLTIGLVLCLSSSLFAPLPSSISFSFTICKTCKTTSFLFFFGFPWISQRINIPFPKAPVFWFQAFHLKMSNKTSTKNQIVKDIFKVKYIDLDWKTWAVWVIFSLGQNKDYSSGGRHHFREIWKTTPKRYGGRSPYMWFWWKSEVLATRSTFYRNLLLVSWRLLLVTRNRCYQEGFSCFYRYEEMQEMGT